MAENVTRIQIETREGGGRLASETSRSEGVSKPGGQASEQAQRPPGIITSPESAKQSQLLQEASSQQSATLAKIESFLSSSSRESSREGQFSPGPFQPPIHPPVFDPETGEATFPDVQKELSDLVATLRESGAVSQLKAVPELKTSADFLSEIELKSTISKALFDAREDTDKTLAPILGKSVSDLDQPKLILPGDASDSVAASFDPETGIGKVIDVQENVLENLSALPKELSEALVNLPQTGKVTSEDLQDLANSIAKKSLVATSFEAPELTSPWMADAETGDPGFIDPKDHEKDLEIKRTFESIFERLEEDKKLISDLTEGLIEIIENPEFEEFNRLQEKFKNIVSEFGVDSRKMVDFFKSDEGERLEELQKRKESIPKLLHVSKPVGVEEEDWDPEQKPEPDKEPSFIDDIVSVFKDDLFQRKKVSFSPTKILRDVSKLQTVRAAKAAATGTVTKAAAVGVGGLSSFAGGLVGGLVGAAVLAPLVEAIAGLAKLPLQIGKSIVEAGASQIEYAGMLNIGTAQALAREEVSEFRIRMRRADAIGFEMREFVEARVDLAQTTGGIGDIAMKPIVALGTGILKVLDEQLRTLLDILKFLKPFIDTIAKITPGALEIIMNSVLNLTTTGKGWQWVRRIIGMWKDETKEEDPNDLWNQEVLDFFSQSSNELAWNSHISWGAQGAWEGVREPTVIF